MTENRILTFDSGHGGHRRLVLLLGDLSWRLAYLEQELTQLQKPQGLWIGQSLIERLPSVSAKQLPHLLGQEVDFIVFHGEDGLSPNALGIAGGMIRAGGVCFFSLPKLEHWLRLANPAAQNWLSYPHSPEEALRGFNQHFWQSWQCFQMPPPVCPQSDTFDEQQQAMNAIVHCAQGHRHRPLVITADRGRGKSYALGLACHQLFLQRKNLSIAVTASRSAQTEQVFQAFWHQYHQCSENTQKKAAKPPGLVELDGFELRFISPDALLLDKPKFDLVLVDEAAQLPVPLLSELAQDHSRIVFTTTTHGYEGSGRGFGINFYKQLDKHTPGWQRLHLNQPIRWSNNDPLEAFINQLLLIPTEEAPPLANRAPIQILSRQPLSLTSEELKQVFQLLLSAHYQTQPNDLLQLLEAPNLQLQLAQAGQQIIGVVLAVAEGDLPEMLYQQHERRVQGHLMPQLLYKQSGKTQWLKLKTWRIQRIAVAPPYQRQGIGKKLIAALTERAIKQKLDMLSTSFGADESLLRFWQTSGFKPVHFGLKRDKASASHSIALTLPLSPSAQDLCQQQQQAWQWQFAYQLQHELTHLPLSLAISVLQFFDFPQPAFPAGICQAIHTPYEAVSWKLWHWLLGQIKQLELTQNNQAIIQKMLFAPNWQTLCAQTGLSRKQIEQQLTDLCKIFKNNAC